MFKMKKLGAVAASLAFAGALALTGCGNSDAPADAAGSADASGSDTMQLVTDGTLTIGTSAEYEPFEYMEDGEYKGFDLELAQAIADDLGLELKIENVDFDTIVPGVASGTKYDMGIAAITATPEREKEVGFTDSYYMDDQAIVTMADNTEITGDNYADALNAEGVKIAVQSGSTAEAFAKENFPNADKTFRKLVPVQFSKLLANRSKNLDCGCKDHHLSSTLDNSFTVGTHSFGRGNHHSGQTRNTNEAGGKLFCVQICDLFKCTRQNKHRRSNTEHSRYTLHHTSYLTTDLVKHCHRSSR